MVRLNLGVSTEKRLETGVFTDSPFNSDAFIDFLEEIARVKGPPPALFMDNVKYHKSIATK